MTLFSWAPLTIILVDPDQWGARDYVAYRNIRNPLPPFRAGRRCNPLLILGQSELSASYREADISVTSIQGPITGVHPPGGGAL